MMSVGKGQRQLVGLESGLFRLLEAIGGYRRRREEGRRGDGEEEKGIPGIQTSLRSFESSRSVLYDPVITFERKGSAWGIGRETKREERIARRTSGELPTAPGPSARFYKQVGDLSVSLQQD